MFLAKTKYRPCVGICLFNQVGRVFVGERIDTPGGWQMPQGGIDNGEDLKTAAFRELKEEVGTDKADIIRIADQTVRYDLPDDLRARLWGGQYKGQEQIWIAMRFTGRDADIILDRDERPEFSQWDWVNFDSVVDRIVPFKRKIYSQVYKMFSDLV